MASLSYPASGAHPQQVDAPLGPLTKLFQPAVSAIGGLIGIRLGLVLQFGGFVLCGRAQILHFFPHGGGWTCSSTYNLEPRAELVELAREFTNAHDGISDTAAQG